MNGRDFDFLHDPALAQRLEVLAVRAADCEERFVLGRGPGGQKVNKTSSTVHLRHRPSGIEIRMQQERSQTRNRWQAWCALADRLEADRRAAQDAARDARELDRRRTRQRSRAQKARMLDAKRHRTRRKTGRRPEWGD